MCKESVCFWRGSGCTSGWMVVINNATECREEGNEVSPSWVCAGA